MTSPRITFVIGGAQKAGTTALATYMSAFSDICLPLGKEAHLFDHPDFDESWTAADIDSRFAAFWPRTNVPCLVGDATPLYMFDERLIRRISAYNPTMRWIILLRDPVDRSLSHYYMERGRGNEHLPLAAALLGEPYRLWRHRTELTQDSPRIMQSYVARSRYCRQLDALFRHTPRHNVLLLRTCDLRQDPAAVVAGVRQFLGLPQAHSPAEFPPVFEGRYERDGDRIVRRILKTLFRREVRELNRRYAIDLTN
ncbi:deacetylase sulfotransferase [Lysobacter xinjiangensis]|uniref:Deacetylase sulfotransferase n=1 Tax=Cognatilysobacter xinjiangensis TaxID=546892 RepID=A0ABQ3C6L5_9GAMM|nr:sulfotransferase domain-containing protein [Lysobacter xinjiangensis]GGZ70771.1 deacetylase sulfotransferase [Lysobacter xinjiangensis]